MERKLFICETLPGLTPRFFSTAAISGRVRPGSKLKALFITKRFTGTVEVTQEIASLLTPICKFISKPLLQFTSDVNDNSTKAGVCAVDIVSSCYNIIR